METTRSTPGENFFAVFNACPEAMAVLRLADSHCLAVNASFTALTGFTAAEMGLAAREAGAWISAADWLRLTAEIQSAGQADELNLTLHTQGGAAYQAQMSARPLEFAGAPSLLVIAHPRPLAEAEARAGEPHAATQLSPAATRQMLHELQVHQTELEMQNEELRRTQAELEASRARYLDLYDLAPVGYVTLNEAGLILEANLAAANLLGLPRKALVKQPLTRFVVPEDQDRYYQHRRQL